MVLAPAFSSSPNWTRAAFHGSKTPELYVRALVIRTRKSARSSTTSLLINADCKPFKTLQQAQVFGKRKYSGCESVAFGKKSPLLLTVKNVMVLVPWGSITALLYAHIYTDRRWVAWLLEVPKLAEQFHWDSVKKVAVTLIDKIIVFRSSFLRYVQFTQLKTSFLSNRLGGWVNAQSSGQCFPTNDPRNCVGRRNNSVAVWWDNSIIDFLTQGEEKSTFIYFGGGKKLKERRGVR